MLLREDTIRGSKHASEFWLARRIQAVSRVRIEDRSKLLLPEEPPEKIDEGCASRIVIHTSGPRRGLDRFMSRQTPLSVISVQDLVTRLNHRIGKQDVDSSQIKLC
jgi:hypothetical protein